MDDLFEFSSTIKELSETLEVQLSSETIPDLLPDLLDLLPSKLGDPDEDGEIEIVRYFNEDDQPLLTLLTAFQHGVAKLSPQLGKPFYVGKGERHGPRVDCRGAFFWSADQAIEIALWQRDAETIAFMLTGHDADSLLTLTLGIHVRS